MKKSQLPLHGQVYRDAYSPLDRHAPALIAAELLLIGFVVVEAASRVFGLAIPGRAHAWLALLLFWAPLFYLAGFVLLVTVESRWKYVALAAWAVLGLAGGAALIAAGVGAL